MKGVKRFGKKGKLSPRYVGPYRVLNRVGKTAYEIELPAELSAVHLVFHVSMLKNHIGDSVVIDPSEGCDVQDSLLYNERLVEILDYQVRRLRNKEVPLVKVLCRNQSVEGATWEAESDMRASYPHLFSTSPNQAKGTIPLI